jgi:excisionase family DNA binding protein
MPKQSVEADTLADGRGREMVTADEIATLYLVCSTRHVRRMADSGRMPKPVKLGSLIRWPRAVIEQWIADGCPHVRNANKGARS